MYSTLRKLSSTPFKTSLYNIQKFKPTNKYIPICIQQSSLHTLKKNIPIIQLKNNHIFSNISIQSNLLKGNIIDKILLLTIIEIIFFFF
jgi:hypothetical protein